MTFLEGILSRGDRRLSEVIYSAFKNGARMDAWSNHFSLEIWLKAFSEHKLEPGFYLKEKSYEEILPWDFLDIGPGKAALIQEAKDTKVLI